MNELTPQTKASLDAEKAAYDSLILLGEAKEKSDNDAYRIAYDSYMRAIRDMDVASFDANIVDDYGNVMKQAGQFGESSSSKRAWDHKLPEDG
tara:strand:- start:440 stop:718 length:279 start_codon:yes stop_codon:yes gene_type:complete